MADSAQDAAQDVVIGFSGSSCSSYVGAYCSWGKSPSCTAMKGPMLLKPGEAHYAESRWGDYSFTTLDPGDPEDPDGLSIWTVQQYALPSPSPYPPDFPWWGTWIVRIKP